MPYMTIFHFPYGRSGKFLSNSVVGGIFDALSTLSHNDCRVYTYTDRIVFDIEQRGRREIRNVFIFERVPCGRSGEVHLLMPPLSSVRHRLTSVSCMAPM